MRYAIPPLAPDAIQSFGYKNAWIAIQTDDLPSVLAALDLKDWRVASWAEGLQMACDHPDAKVFVTPPVHGHILCVSKSFFKVPTARSADEITPLLERLAKKFPEVQYFLTYRVVSAHAWARYQDGRCVRAFATVDFTPSWNSGELTPVETRLDLDCPDEEDVMTIAGDWSVNPTDLETNPVEVTQGIIGML